MNLSTVILLGIGRHTPGPDWRLAGQIHPHHEMIIILRGSQYVQVQGDSCKAEAGDVFWFPEGVSHTEWGDPCDPVESLFISLK